MWDFGAIREREKDPKPYGKAAVDREISAPGVIKDAW
jgi:hypothetical protein